MNLDNIPSRSEVLVWNSEHLAAYLKRMRLVGCDTVVKRSGMNGARFLTMSSSDLQKFPNAQIPLLIKICTDINQGGKKSGMFHRPKPSQPPYQGFGHNHETWETETCQSDSDPDYEDPDAEDTYICAIPDDHNEQEDEYDYEAPPSETPSEIPSHFRIANPLGDGDYYIDGVRRCPTKEQIKRTQLPDSALSPPARSNAKILPATASKLDSSSHRPLTSGSKPKTTTAAPHIDRRTKPRLSGFSKTSPDISEGRCHPTNTTENLQSASHLKPQPPGRVTSSHVESSFFLSEQQNLMVQHSEMAQDMDPQWYVGSMTRGEAEIALRKINKDGAFLIRDSSKNFTDQPYTLMVLNKQKVYNIQIRFHGNDDSYSLGTGLSGIESFPNVKDMVTYYTKTHLMLIDAMERATGAQHQCCLMYPARG